MQLDFEILVVGAGLSGIATGIKLKKAGFHDFAIIEKADAVGGTWRDNTYPGLAVDIPTLTYSYSFEQNPDWSNLYAPGSELKAYADHCTDKYGVRSHVQFNRSIRKAVYDEERNVWQSHLEDGSTLTSRYLVSATGFLQVAKMPEIEGIESFEGKLMHTAAWDHDHDLEGRRVAVIGTGATGIQLVPEIAPRVEHLDVYQRTPIWLLPKADLPVGQGMRKALRYVPGLQWGLRILMFLVTDVVMVNVLKNYRRFSRLAEAAERKCIEHVRSQVDDPVLQEKLIPRYSFGCKRPSFSNTFYLTFNRQNVELVTEPIERITETGIVTADGKQREIDTLICATGFDVFGRKTVPTFPVYGREGAELTDFWEQNRYQAFMGATVPNYPNYFMVFGPYSVASASFVGMIENQTRHLVRCLVTARKRGANYVEVKQASHDRDFEEVLRRRGDMVWALGRCEGSNSYYFDRHGDYPGLRPLGSSTAWWRSHFFSMNHYQFASR
jgi:cation diffusion facilitator CzcD-associated flavoprotein CzcO